MDTKKKPDDVVRISPAFAGCSEAIVFCANDFFCPYLYVMLYSVLEHTSISRSYDIVILHRDISDENQAILQNLCAGKEHVSIRFANVAAMIAGYSLYTGGKEVFSVDAYLRLLIPDVLDDSYKKALYLDSDMLALTDVGALLDTDLDGFLLASSRDLAGLAEYYHPTNKNRKRYRDEVLQLSKPDDYFIDGMLVLNLEAFRREYTSEMLLKLAASREWLQHDQDVLNLICNGGKAKIVHAQWDVMVVKISSFLPEQYRVELEESMASPKIVHFGGDKKPWKETGNPWDDLFWDIALKTPYIKTIIYRAIDSTNNKCQKRFEDLRVSVTYRVGLIVTWVPHAIHRLIKWFQNRIGRG